MYDNHTFVDAYFLDEDRTVCESLWYSADENVYRTHVAIAEEGDAEWQKLLEYPIDDTGRTITLEDLYERTYIKLKEDKEAFKEIIKGITDEDEFAGHRVELQNQIENLKKQFENEKIEFENNKENFKKQNIISLLDILVNLDKSRDSEDDNKEQLFLFKLALFEWDMMSDLKDKELKREIRKSKSVLEALSLAINYLVHQT